ncbi:MAG: SPOR domain-containing protein [Alphaproteobacteria bacterium]
MMFSVDFKARTLAAGIAAVTVCCGLAGGSAHAREVNEACDQARLNGDASGLATCRKAAESGVAVAQYFMGLMYANGDGVPRDRDAGFNWLRKAVENGYPSAPFVIEALYPKRTKALKDNPMVAQGLVAENLPESGTVTQMVRREDGSLAVVVDEEQGKMMGASGIDVVTRPKPVESTLPEPRAETEQAATAAETSQVTTTLEATPQDPAPASPPAAEPVPESEPEVHEEKPVRAFKDLPEPVVIASQPAAVDSSSAEHASVEIEVPASLPEPKSAAAEPDVLGPDLEPEPDEREVIDAAIPNKVEAVDNSLVAQPEPEPELATIEPAIAEPEQTPEPDENERTDVTIPDSIKAADSNLVTQTKPTQGPAESELAIADEPTADDAPTAAKAPADAPEEAPASELVAAPPAEPALVLEDEVPGPAEEAPAVLAEDPAQPPLALNAAAENELLRSGPVPPSASTPAPGPETAIESAPVNGVSLAPERIEESGEWDIVLASQVSLKREKPVITNPDAAPEVTSVAKPDVAEQSLAEPLPELEPIQENVLVASRQIRPITGPPVARPVRKSELRRLEAMPVPEGPSESWLIDLGTYSSPRAATRAWATLTGRHAQALEGMVEVLEQSGSQSRLSAGPVATRDQADALCATLRWTAPDCSPRLAWANTSPQDTGGLEMPTTTGEESWMLDLGEFGSQGAATAAWRRLRAGDSRLGRMAHYLEQAGTGSRLLAGPAGTREFAMALCNTLRELTHACTPRPPR